LNIPVRSYGSVKIISFDTKSAVKNLKEAANKLKNENQNVSGVYLFGSLARGDAVPGSDADILIVLKESQKRAIDRIDDFIDYFSGLGFGVDIFAYTIEELKSLKKENLFVKKVEQRGIYVDGQALLPFGWGYICRYYRFPGLLV